MNSDPGSVSVSRLAAEERGAEDVRGVEADLESVAPRAGRRSERINVCLSRTKMSKFVELVCTIQPTSLHNKW